MKDQWAVLWDMDGVLIDTTQLHYQTWVNTLAAYGVEYTFEDFNAQFGSNNRRVMALVMDNPSEELIQEVTDKKESRYREMVREHVDVYPGVEDWLKRFQAWHLPQAICSSAPQENIDASIAATGFASYFDLQVSAALFPSKPNPEVYLRASRHFGIPPQRCLVIEDATVGVEGAHRAGMKCLAVLTTHSAEEMAAADLIVKDLSQLKEAQLRSFLGI